MQLGDFSEKIEKAENLINVAGKYIIYETTIVEQKIVDWNLYNKYIINT